MERLIMWLAVVMASGCPKRQCTSSSDEGADCPHEQQSNGEAPRCSRLARVSVSDFNAKDEVRYGGRKSADGDN